MRVAPCEFDSILDLLRENGGGNKKGSVNVGLLRIREGRLVSHALADRGDVDTSGDTQVRQLGWISNSREHERMRSVERPRAQIDLFASCNFPSLTHTL